MDTAGAPRWVAVAGVLAAVLTALVGAYVALKPKAVHAGICTVAGIRDANYVNAVLTGHSTNDDDVAVVGETNPDEDLWYFKPVHKRGNSWAITASDKWEVSRPNDRRNPNIPFTFQAFARPDRVVIPARDQGVEKVPPGLRPVGDEVARTRRQLIGQPYKNPDC